MGSLIEDAPNQVVLGIASGKFLRFVVKSKRIHLDLEKVRAIQEMQPLEKSQGNQRLTGTIGLYPEIYIESFRMLPTFYQTDE